MLPGAHLPEFLLKLRVFPSSQSCHPFPGFSQVMFTQPAGPVDRFGPTMKILEVLPCSNRQPSQQAASSRIKPHQAASSRIKPHQAESSRQAVQNHELPRGMLLLSTVVAQIAQWAMKRVSGMKSRAGKMLTCR